MPKNVRVTAKNNLMQGFNFILYLNNFTYGFQSIDGLRVDLITTDNITEGGVNDHPLLVGTTNPSNFTLTLTRGMVLRHSSLLTNAALAAVGQIPNQVARKAAMLAVSCTSAQDALEKGPALGFIEVYGRDENLEAVYSFLSLGAISWESTGLNAQNTDILFETITLAHQGLTRLPLTFKPQIFMPADNYSDDADISESARAAERKKREEERKKKIQEYKQQVQNTQNQLEEQKKKLENDILKYQRQLQNINNQLANLQT